MVSQSYDADRRYHPTIPADILLIFCPLLQGFEYILFALFRVTFRMLDYIITLYYSGSSVNVGVVLEREDEVAGPVLAPLFPQVII